MCYISFYVKFNAVPIETCDLSRKLSINHVIAFASGEGGYADTINFH